MEDRSILERQLQQILAERHGTPFDPTARCPIWLSFLAYALPDAAERQALHVAVGQTFIGSSHGRQLFLIQSPVPSGKSLFLHMLAIVFGPTATLTAPATLLTESSKSRGWSRAAAQCTDKLFVTLYTDGRPWRVSNLKTLLSADLLSVEPHSGDPIQTIQLRCRFWCAVQNPPVFDRADLAATQRVRIFSWTTEEPQVLDPQLKRELRKELPGIFNWVLRGAHLALDGAA